MPLMDDPGMWKTAETRKKSFQIILRPDVIIALFLFLRGATKCSSTHWEEYRLLNFLVVQKTVCTIL